jgi:hypothetical protein
MWPVALITISVLTAVGVVLTREPHLRDWMPPITNGPLRAAAVDLFWLPLGAGGYSVRLNGRVFEEVAARLIHRSVNDLYHSALEVHLPDAGRTRSIRRSVGGHRAGTPAS